MNFTETSEITQKAEENISELAAELFNNKRMKFLNFKEIKGEKQNEQEIRT